MWCSNHEPQHDNNVTKEGLSSPPLLLSTSNSIGIGHTDDQNNPSTSTLTAPGGKGVLGKPIASVFARRCYFTKSGIGKNTQHYEGLTLTGNTVLMLSSAMKLKGCPTICDEDLRRVESIYPNQFSRLPDEIGWCTLRNGGACIRRGGSCIRRNSLLRRRSPWSGRHRQWIRCGR